jgi:amino acid transporter
VGFGLDDAGVKAYGASAAPNTDLATSFVGSWFAMVLNAGAAISTFACALASADGAARVVFSLGRDGRIPTKLAAIHPTHHSPHWALGVSMVIGLLIAAAFVPFTDSPSNVYGWTGALATLAVIIAYGMTSVAAAIYFWKDDIAKRHYHQFVPLLVAVPLLAYTFYSQILPVPPAPLRYWPYVMLVFLGIGAGILWVQRDRVVARDAAWEDRKFEARPGGIKA